MYKACAARHGLKSARKRPLLWGWRGGGLGHKDLSADDADLHRWKKENPY